MRSYRRVISILLIATACFLCSAKNFVIIIDAGHGGKDPGAIGPNGTQEKVVTLAVAKKLGKLISDDKSVTVVYTRPSDTHVSLAARANIANKRNGDLFISIHTNSSLTNPETCRGTEAFVMGSAKSDNNYEVVERENRDLISGAAYKNFDPNSTEAGLIYQNRQELYLERSYKFAKAVQKNMVATGRYDRGVKQANFYVLWSVNMPSILVELDFICNPTQEEFLGSDEGQDDCAEAIYEAFLSYRHSQYGTPKEETKPSKDDSGEKKKKEKKKKKSEPSDNKDKNDDNNAEVVDNVKPSTDTTDKQNKEDQIQSAVNDNGSYHIQILAADTKIPGKSWQFKGLSPVHFYFENGIYKYYYGESTTKADIERLLGEVKKKFPKAFIIRLLNGKRVEYFN